MRLIASVNDVVNECLLTLSPWGLHIGYTLPKRNITDLFNVFVTGGPSGLIIIMIVIIIISPQMPCLRMRVTLKRHQKKPCVRSPPTDRAEDNTYFFPRCVRPGETNALSRRRFHVARATVSQANHKSYTVVDEH